MPRHTHRRPPAAGLLSRLFERLRGREQKLIRPPTAWPLLLLNFPSGRGDVAGELERAYLHTWPALPEAGRAPYEPMAAKLPGLVVVLLRPYNLCGCLGHHHPPGTETRLTRRLAGEFSSTVGEIDLAYEGIREWQPRPLASLAAEVPLAALHFHAGLLAVLLHELEHLAHPEHTERHVRGASDDLYFALMRYLVRTEEGREYGMESQP